MVGWTWERETPWAFVGNARPLTTGRRGEARSCPRWSSSLSEPFLQRGNVFDFPRVVTISPSLNDAFAKVGVAVQTPDLIGLCTWFIALYFGYSEKVRLGTALRQALTRGLVNAKIPESIADSIATGLHTFPFLFGAIFIDGFLRGTLGDSFAAAGGVTLSLWAGVYELGRPKPKTQEEKDAERAAWTSFLEFAEKRLERRGNCHYLDIEKAFRTQYPRYRDQKKLSDRTLRRFLAVWAPSAQRTPNGYYKNISVRRRPDVFN